MRYQVTLKHENEKWNRNLSFEDYEIAEAHYKELAVLLLKELGNYTLFLERLEDNKMLLQSNKNL